MARGDQIYVMRDLVGIPGRYQHHGIDCGGGTVIHYRKTDGEAQVARTSMAMFTRGNPVTMVLYPRGGTFVPEVVIQRAESRLGERKYDLFLNNCEHFANWCKTGVSESQQLARFGLRLDQLQLPEMRRLMAATAHDRSPEQAIALFQKAMGDVAGAYATIQQQHQTAREEEDTWQRVAQAALDKDREDLARAALHRKLEAQKRSDRLQQHLAELVDIQLDLERNQEFSARRFRESAP